MKKQKTIYTKSESVHKQWVVVDACDEILGRLASRVAMMMRGKCQANFEPSVDAGVNVIIVNADKIRFTGNKLKDKVYYSHSGYPGGLKSVGLGFLMKTNPERVVTHALKGMLPKNRLNLMRNVRIYRGPQHPHEAQIMGNKE